MPFSPVWTEEAETQFSELMGKAQASLRNRKENKKAKPSREEGLFKQAQKCIAFLLNDPKHPSLKTHQYEEIPNPYDAKEKVFEAYAQNNTSGAHRIFWCYGPEKGEITILAITPHP